MVNAKKTTDKSSNAGAKAHKKNAIEDVAHTNGLALTASAFGNTSSKATDAVKTLRSYGGNIWSNRKLGTLGQMTGKISTPGTNIFAARQMIASADAVKLRLVKQVEEKPFDPKGLGTHACTAIDSSGTYANIHANATTSKNVFKKLGLGDTFVVAKTVRMFYNPADGRHNFVVSEQSNERFATTFAPWPEDSDIPCGRFNPMNVTHFPEFIAKTNKAGRRIDAVGLVTDFKYTQGTNGDEQTQRNKTRCTFLLMGKYCNNYYLRVTIWGEPAMELGNKYDDPEDGSLTAFVKNAGVVEREVGEEITIELTHEYNTLPIFVDTNDPRLQESKVNVVADVDADLTPLNNDVKKVRESESERTNVETHRRSPKKGSPKEHLSVDDDDEGDALPTEVASPEQPQSKATKTLKLPQQVKPAARSTPTTELAKDAIDVGNEDDEDDENFSRIQRKSKRTKAN